MVALVKLIRFYDDALRTGIAGANADEIRQHPAKYSFSKRPRRSRLIVSQAIDPDADLNIITVAANGTAVLRRHQQIRRARSQVSDVVKSELRSCHGKTARALREKTASQWGRRPLQPERRQLVCYEPVRRSFRARRYICHQDHRHGENLGPQKHYSLKGGGFRVRREGCRASGAIPLKQPLALNLVALGIGDIIA